MRHGRIILAFLIAPLMTPVVFIVAALVQGNFHMPEQILSYSQLYGLFAYLATAIFGIPAFFIYRALKWSNVFLFIMGGAVIGFIVSLFILESYPLEYFLQQLEGHLLCTLAGA